MLSASPSASPFAIFVIRYLNTPIRLEAKKKARNFVDSFNFIVLYIYSFGTRTCIVKTNP